MTVTFGTAKVTIRPNDGGFRSSLIVNGDQVVLAKGHATQAAASRWADKVLREHAARV